MKSSNPLSAPATAGSEQKNSSVLPRALGAFGLSLMLGLIASCSSPKEPVITRTGSGMKPEPAATNMMMTMPMTNMPATMPMTTPARPATPDASGLATAGELIVSLDARDPSAGTEKWVNKGSMGDFTRIGSPKVATTGGQPAVQFNGTSDAYRSDNPTPDTITGAHARSIEVWAFNPSVDSREESMVAWGHRGAALANMAFSYGNDTGFGAVVNYNTDMGWGDEPPATGQWHLLTYTYDGKTAKIYDNGTERGSGAFALVTAVNRMVIGTENSAEGAPIFSAEFDDPWTLGFSGSIASVRVCSGALSAEQVKADFNADKARFGVAGQ